ncbi:hypothetical protein L596_016067 [Steinernema carpocapsae]|uniref:G-protein coupled receptors family 1 profile domain-containing protein n=1 Tax=Steinernema carpocapsae TaxID=34508 RepID=A0A4U5NGW8_STECR|nr:hypothetical protein L596_016067 [Steinernema carpocapsae]
MNSLPPQAVTDRIKRPTMITGSLSGEVLRSIGGLLCQNASMGQRCMDNMMDELEDMGARIYAPETSFDDHNAVQYIRITFFAVTVPFNLLILFTILHSQSLRKKDLHLLLVNLGIAHLISATSAVTRVIGQAVFKGNYTTTRCLALGIPLILGNHCVQIAMTLIGLDRLHQVRHILKSNKTLPRNLYLCAIPLTVAISLIPTGLMFIGTEEEAVNNCQTSGSWTGPFRMYLFVGTLCFAALIWIPGFYIWIIYRKTVKHMKKVPAKSGQPQIPRTFASMAKLFLPLIANYGMLWFVPKMTMLIFMHFDWSSRTTDILQVTSMLTELLATLINVFIYMLNREIQAELKGFFTFMKKKALTHMRFLRCNKKPAVVQVIPMGKIQGAVRA